ncbi:MAG TPA: hypothetical protein PK823_16715, partial [Novosphingobium sp.]|nr:hypothetical protein [Novosphingobium sp.]
EIKCGQIPHTNCLGRMIGAHRCLPVRAGQWRIRRVESTKQRITTKEATLPGVAGRDRFPSPRRGGR